jgi:X-X-X-Leu-X-X-Gly heptad repeat protein
MPLTSIALIKTAVGIIGAGISLAKAAEAGDSNATKLSDKLSEAIFSETFGGIFADWVKGGADAGYARLKEKLNGIEYSQDSLNHDLQRAARKAQLIATFFACQSCLAKLEAEKFARQDESQLARIRERVQERVWPGDAPEKKYLSKVIKYLNAEIKNNEAAVYGSKLTFVEFSSIFDTYAIVVDEGKQANFAQQLKREFLDELRLTTKLDLGFQFDKKGFGLLEEAVLSGWEEIPADVESHNYFGTTQSARDQKFDWFNLVCLIFNEEYKNNPKVLAASQKQLLLEISRRLDQFGKLDGQAVDTITNGIAKLAGQLTTLQAGVDKANREIEVLLKRIAPDKLNIAQPFVALPSLHDKVYGRNQEIEQLLAFLRSNTKHGVLIAPTCFGKTFLLKKFLFKTLGVTTVKPEFANLFEKVIYLDCRLNTCSFRFFGSIDH